MGFDRNFCPMVETKEGGPPKGEEGDVRYVGWNHLIHSTSIVFENGKWKVVRIIEPRCRDEELQMEREEAEIKGWLELK